MMLNGYAKEVWKWISGVLLTACAFLAGGFIGDIRAAAAVTELAREVESHVQAEAGHPVTNARLVALEKQLDRIEDKLDRLREGQ